MENRYIINIKFKHRRFEYGGVGEMDYSCEKRLCIVCINYM